MKEFLDEKSYLIKIKELGRIYAKEKVQRIKTILSIDKFMSKIEERKIENYIKQKLQKGYTEQMILEAAKKSGWNKALIKAILKKAKKE